MTTLEKLQEQLRRVETFRWIGDDIPAAIAVMNIAREAIDTITAQAQEIATLNEHLQVACVAAGFTDTVSVDELNVVIEAQDGYTGKPKKLINEIAAKDKRIADLEAALREWKHHSIACRSNRISVDHPDCDCGLSQARALLRTPGAE